MNVEQILVKVNGRLGNQLFQYAFARTLQLKYGGKLILDFSPMAFSHNHRHLDGWENSLDYFNIGPYTYVDLDNLEESGETRNQRFLYKSLNKLKSISPKVCYFIERFDFLLLRLYGLYYMESYNTSSHTYSPLRKKLMLRGWFESASFFKDFDSQICKELTPKGSMSDVCESMYENLFHSKSLCVSVRRGDFLKYKDYNVCSIEYFNEGIKYIISKFDCQTLFLCSDDVEWCKKNLQLPELPISYQMPEMKSWETLRLMSACQYFVICNSTFAWWGQHLSQRENKVVIAPDRWRIQIPQVKDIYEENWVIL